MDKIRGEVRTVNLDRGFGFIAAEDRRDYFFHFDNVLKGTISPQRLVIGDKVLFNIQENEDLKRNPQAINVEYVRPETTQPTKAFATLADASNSTIKGEHNA
jgi:cold shock CspA family protein